MHDLENDQFGDVHVALVQRLMKTHCTSSLLACICSTLTLLHARHICLCRDLSWSHDALLSSILVLGLLWKFMGICFLVAFGKLLTF